MGEQALSLASDDDAVIYNAACALAVLGEIDRALDALELAIDAGLTGGDWVPRDPDWERLRDHPRFQALAKRLSRSTRNWQKRMLLRARACRWISATLRRRPSLRKR